MNPQILEDRIYAVLEENGEQDISDIAQFIIERVRMDTYDIYLDTVFDFAEEYGCSIDYLCGRSDVYSVM